MAKWNPNLIPLNGAVLVERDSTEKKSKGGIIIPEVSQEKVTKGTVVAICEEDGDPDAATCPVEIGDIVMFGKYSGHDLDVDGHDCVLVKFEDLTCKLGE